MAKPAGFEVACIKVDHEEKSFVSVDEFLEFWSGVSHGAFSVSDVDEKTIKRIMRKNFCHIQFHIIIMLCMTVKKLKYHV